MTLFRDILLGQERMQINDAVLISVIHVLGWSGLRFESATADCYDVLQKFLTSHAEAMSSFEDSEKLLVAHVAASYLTKLMQRVDTELPLISLTNALCSSGDNVDNQACLTALVGRVARHANQEMVGEMVLPILIRQFHECRDSNLIAGATLNQLVDLAFINGMESFEEVVNTLAFTSRAVSALSDASNMFVLRMVGQHTWLLVSLIYDYLHFALCAGNRKADGDCAA